MTSKDKSAEALNHFEFDWSAATLMAATDAYVMGGDWDSAVEALQAVLDQAADFEPVKV